ncbi:MAG: response regulator [Phycisphaerales bacterium]
MVSEDFTVHVVDDDDTVRERVRLTLANAGYRVCTYATGEAFIEDNEPEPGCVVLDMMLPGMDGVEVRQTLRERVLPIKVIVATSFADVPLVRDAFRDGVIDVLEKPCDEGVLVETVRHAFETLERECARRERTETAMGYIARLTSRQLEVFELLVQGLISKQIALRLGCSVRTVEAHRGEIMRRLEASSIVELIKLSHDAIGAGHEAFGGHPGSEQLAARVIERTY